jgi:hypothetical protein
VIVVGTGCHGNETGMGGSNREVIIGSSTVSIGDKYFNKDETKGMDEKVLKLHPQKKRRRRYPGTPEKKTLTRFRLSRVVREMR